MKKKSDNKAEIKANIRSDKLTGRDYVIICIEAVLGLCALCVLLINCISIYGLVDVGDMWSGNGSIAICLAVMFVCECILCVAFHDRILAELGPILAGLIFSCLFWNGSYIFAIAAVAILVGLCIFRIIRHNWVKWTGKLVITIGVIMEAYSLLWFMSGEEATIFSQQMIGSVWVDVILVFGVVILFLPQKAMDVMEGRRKLQNRKNDIKKLQNRKNGIKKLQNRKKDIKKLKNRKKDRKKKIDEIEIFDLEELEELEELEALEAAEAEAEAEALEAAEAAAETEASVAAEADSENESPKSEDESPKSEDDTLKADGIKSGAPIMGAYPGIRYSLYLACSMVFAFLAYSVSVFKAQSILWTEWDKWEQTVTKSGVQTAETYIRLIIFGGAVLAAVWVFFISEFIRHIQREKGNLYNALTAVIIVCLPIYIRNSFTTDGIWQILFMTVLWAVIYIGVMAWRVNTQKEKRMNVLRCVFAIAAIAFSVGLYFIIKKELFEIPQFGYGLLTAVTVILIRYAIGLLETENGKEKVPDDGVLNIILAAGFISVVFLCCGAFGKMWENAEDSTSSYEELLAQLETIADINGDKIAYVNSDEEFKRYYEYFYEGEKSIDLYDSICEELFIYNASVIPKKKVTNTYLLLAKHGDSVPDVWIENMSHLKKDVYGWLPELYTVESDVSGCSIIANNTSRRHFEAKGYEMSEIESTSVASKKADITDGTMDMWEWYGNEYVAYSGSYRAISKGGIVYGPYEHIDAGEYILVFTGDNLDEAVIDVNSNTAGLMDIQVIAQDTEHVIVLTTIPEAVDDIEFRVYNLSSQNVIFLSKMSIARTY